MQRAGSTQHGSLDAAGLNEAEGLRVGLGQGNPAVPHWVPFCAKEPMAAAARKRARSISMWGIQNQYVFERLSILL